MNYFRKVAWEELSLECNGSGPSSRAPLNYEENGTQQKARKQEDDEKRKIRKGRRSDPVSSPVESLTDESPRTPQLSRRPGVLCLSPKDQKELLDSFHKESTKNNNIEQTCTEW